MPKSKHRKKGQAKAVKRPGRSRAVAEPKWMGLQRRLEDVGMEMVGVDAMDEHDFEVAALGMEVIMDEVLAIDVSGEGLSQRIGSRAEAVEAFATLAREDAGAGALSAEVYRALGERALGWFAACGFIRFDEDQLILAVEMPGR